MTVMSMCAKRFLLYFFFSIASVGLQAQDLSQLRNAYKAARELESSNEFLYKTLSSKQSKSATEVAYEAGSKALKAKYSSNPYRKLYWIKEAEKSFSAAVAMNPEGFEIRYLRYAVELNTPAITGCSSHLNEDRTFLIQAIRNKRYAASERELVQEVIRFLKLYSNLSTSELNLLQEAF